MESKQELEVRLQLLQAISDLPFWQEHDFGYIPYNINELMVNAAMNVLFTVKATNDYYESENPS